MSEDYRTVNGVQLTCGYTWVAGSYLISTDSYSAATSGIGYFTVSRIDTITHPYPDVKLVYVDRMLSLADAVTLTEVDAERRRTPVPVIPIDTVCMRDAAGDPWCERSPRPDRMTAELDEVTCPACRVRIQEQFDRTAAENQDLYAG